MSSLVPPVSRCYRHAVQQPTMLVRAIQPDPLPGRKKVRTASGDRTASGIGAYRIGDRDDRRLRRYGAVDLPDVHLSGSHSRRKSSIVSELYGYCKASGVADKRLSTRPLGFILAISSPQGDTPVKQPTSQDTVVVPKGQTININSRARQGRRAEWLPSLLVRKNRNPGFVESTSSHRKVESITRDSKSTNLREMM